MVCTSHQHCQSIGCPWPVKTDLELLHRCVGVISSVNDALRMLDSFSHAAKLEAGLHQHGEQVQLKHLHLDAALSAYSITARHGSLIVAPKVTD